MRLAVALALVLLLPGCALLERAPELVLRNEDTMAVAGTATAYADGAPGEPGVGGPEITGWQFSIAPGEEQILGRLPQQDAGYLRLVVRLGDGREGEGAVLAQPHGLQAVVVIRPGAVEVMPQTVR